MSLMQYSSPIILKQKETNMLRIAFLSAMLCASLYADAQADERQQYIEQFYQIAVDEMHRAGIPASITLAQGILESGHGKSYLAVHGNNHFGIKCGGRWTGPSVARKDDDLDAHGNLIKSCFRAYNNAEESFTDHSNFLTDPKKAYRYGFLFDLDPKDYVSWAYGLKSAGYATNPTYANQLIKIINYFDLEQYDHYLSREQNLMIANAKRKEVAKKMTPIQKMNTALSSNTAKPFMAGQYTLVQPKTAPRRSRATSQPKKPIALAPTQSQEKGRSIVYKPAYNRQNK